MEMRSQGFTGLVAGVLVFSQAQAQSLTTGLDPVCGLPRLAIQGAATEDSILILRGGDDLGAANTWPAILQLGANDDGQHHHQWMDPEFRASQRRFYRLERQPRVPLRPVPNFRLTDHRGFSHELLREGDAPMLVLAFTDNASLPATWAAIQPLQEAYAAKGVLFWLINPADERSALAPAAASAGVTAPILHDAAQLVARTFEASTAGEVIAIRMSTFETVYRGPAEELCDAPNGTSVRQTYLADALESAMAEKPVAVERVRVRGNLLVLPARTVPNYAQTVAPLLMEKCANCHRPEGIAPWAMTGHDILVAKAQFMRENLVEGLMPPWHADPAHQKFSNDFSLTPEQQATLVDWIDAGTPRGEGLDPLVAVTPEPNEEWPLGKPDAILKIPTQSIPATGKINYLYVPVKNPFNKDVWIRASVVKIGNKAVVHHALIFHAPNVADFLNMPLSQLEEQLGLGGFFAGYVPGMDQGEYPSGTGKLLKAGAGSYFVFQMHYTANGKATTDQTQLGLYVSAAPPAHALETVAGYDKNFVIPAGARGYETVAERIITHDSLLHEMSPHMHYRGDRMRFEAFYPDGTSEILLNVPKYDFAWQAFYRLTEPKILPAGTRIRISGAFDNSSYNPFNPDARQVVQFGEQTNDEMFIGYLGVSRVR